MYFPYSSSNDRQPDLSSAAPFGSSPDGYLIVSAKDLPNLPMPKRVMVTRNQIDIDGWVFPLPYVSKSFLLWFQQTMIRWSKEDDSNQHKEWINAIVEARAIKLGIFQPRMNANRRE